MAEQDRYETALLAAAAILGKLRPEMPRHERLACVTYAILDVLNQADERRPGQRCRVFDASDGCRF